MTEKSHRRTQWDLAEHHYSFLQIDFQLENKDKSPQFNFSNFVRLWWIKQLRQLSLEKSYKKKSALPLFANMLNTLI